MPVAARRRLQANAADAELAVPAGLFLVLAFGVGLAADRFAVGHLGRVQRQVHVVALVQLGDDHFDVLLARARQQKFLGLRVARKTQRRVLFQNSVNRRADAVFIRARLGLDRERDGRLGNMRQRIVNRRGLVAERVAGERFLQFRDGAQIAGVQFGHGGRRLALHHLDVLQALARAAREILRHRVVFQDAGHHLEIADAPGERIGQRLEHKNGKRLGVADFSLHFVALAGGFAVADGRAALRRVRKHFRQQIEQRRAADIVQRGGQHDRVDALGLERFAQALSSSLRSAACPSRKIPPSARRRPRRPFPPAFRARPSRRRPDPRESPRSSACRRRPACRCAPSW